MTNPDRDALTAELAALATRAPDGLLDHVAARWVRVPGALGHVYVASTDRGISFVQIAEAVGDSPAEFARLFWQRFGRPLLAAATPPAGLLSALRTGRATDLQFDLRGLSEFERAVLTTTLRIPKGQTRPYAWVAYRIGHPRAVRAVGSALGHNPVPILIPCHRVVRSDGMTGNYGFGPQVKRALLDAEGANVDEVEALAQRGIHYLASDATGVVCFPTCAHARRITMPHRKGFGTVAQAVAAGYRPCEHCRPSLALSA